MIKVAVIILHYKNWHDTKACLKSLAKINQQQIFLLPTLVNNGKEIPKLNKLRKLLPKLTCISEGRNLGFAGGNNFAVNYLAKHKIDYFLFLNNDTLVDVDKNFLQKLLKTFNETKNLAIAGPCIKHKVNKNFYYDYGGKINKKLAKPFHINKKSHYDKTRYYRDFVSGCCLMIKARILNKVGLFNEKYFAYLEDVELCTRVKSAGYKIILNPLSMIFHKGSRSSTEWLKISKSMVNSIRYALDWTPQPWKFFAIIYNLLFYPSLFLRWQFKRIKQVLSN